MRKSLVLPAHPERICWGCDRYCAADDLACGNGTIRTPHPRELFGDDWLEWSEMADRNSAGDARPDRSDEEE
jgi:hypothetical protein